jgi:hypothetical protein
MSVLRFFGHDLCGFDFLWFLWHGVGGLGGLGGSGGVLVNRGCRSCICAIVVSDLCIWFVCLCDVVVVGFGDLLSAASSVLVSLCWTYSLFFSMEPRL